MRPINYIVVHCTESQPTEKLGDLKNKWREKTTLKSPPFHFIIHPNGEVEKLLWEGFVAPGSNAKNKECIHIAYMGGINHEGNPVDNRTQRQNEALFYKLVQLSDDFRDAQIIGLRDLPDEKTVNPCFDVKEWIKNYVPDLSLDKEDMLMEDELMAA